MLDWLVELMQSSDSDYICQAKFAILLASFYGFLAQKVNQLSGERPLQAVERAKIDEVCHPERNECGVKDLKIKDRVKSDRMFEILREQVPSE